MANGKGEKTSVTLKFPSQPHPTNGFADRCAVFVDDITVEIVFLDSHGGRVLFRLVVDRGTPLVDALLGTSIEFIDTCTRWMAEHNVALVPVVGQPPADSLQAVAPVAANVFRISRIGTEAIFLGYYASPGDLFTVRQTSSQAKSVNVVSVCNIQLGLPVLVGLLQRLREVVG